MGPPVHVGSRFEFCKFFPKQKNKPIYQRICHINPAVGIHASKGFELMVSFNFFKVCFGII